MRKILFYAVFCMLLLLTGCISKPNIDTSEDVTSEESSETQTEITEEMTEANSEATTEEEPVTIDLVELEKLRFRNQYGSYLSDFLRSNELPNGVIFNDSGDDEMSYDVDDDWLDQCEYAILDIDGDGTEELVMSMKGTYSAGQVGLIYQYNPETHSVVEELSTFPAFDTVYSNGVIKMGLSHNQGLAGDTFWPYQLWQYDSGMGVYNEIATVDAWDGNVSPTDYSGNAFPTDLDKDGDGILYTYEYNDDGNKWVDKSQLDQWLLLYTAEGKPIQIEWEKIGDMNWYKYADEMTALLLKYYEDTNMFDDNDMGYTYIKNLNGFDNEQLSKDIINSVSQERGLQVQISDDGANNISATLDGQEVLYSNMGILYGIGYKNTQLEGVSILGIYPGMTSDEAIALMDKTYFYKYYEEWREDDGGATVMYFSGEGEGNIGIYLKIKDGFVEEININKRFSY